MNVFKLCFATNFLQYHVFIDHPIYQCVSRCKAKNVNKSVKLLCIALYVIQLYISPQQSLNTL